MEPAGWKCSLAGVNMKKVFNRSTKYTAEQKQLVSENEIQKSKKGFSLIEIVLAIAIFTFSFLAVLHTQYQATHEVAFNRSLNSATQVGERIADSLEALGINMVPEDTLPMINMSVNNRDYEVEVVVTPSLTKSETSAQGTIVRTVAKRADIQVKWKIGNHDYSTLVQTEIQ